MVDDGETEGGSKNRKLPSGWGVIKGGSPEAEAQAQPDLDAPEMPDLMEISNDAGFKAFADEVCGTEGRLQRSDVTMDIVLGSDGQLSVMGNGYRGALKNGYVEYVPGTPKSFMVQSVEQPIEESGLIVSRTTQDPFYDLDMNDPASVAVLARAAAVAASLQVYQKEYDLGIQQHIWDRIRSLPASARQQFLEGRIFEERDWLSISPRIFEKGAQKGVSIALHDRFDKFAGQYRAKLLANQTNPGPAAPGSGPLSGGK